MQIRSRLTLQFALLVSAILLLAFISIYYFSERRSENEFVKRLREKGITSAVLLLKIERVDSALLKVIDLAKEDVLFAENISVFSQSGREMYTSNDTIQFNVLPELLEEIKKNGEQRFTQGEHDILGMLFKDKSQEYVLLAGAIDVEGHARLLDLRNLLIALFFLMVAIVAMAGWFYSGRALQPITKVMREAQSISSVNLGQRLNGGEKPDEIGKLISIFNNLLDRIENAFNLQKTFVTNVSHELKNPLTTITSQLEVTLLKDRSVEEYKKIALSVLEDIRELNQLSNSLLDLASLNQENVHITRSPVRIDEILWDVRENVQALNTEYKVDVHTTMMPENESELYLNANPYLLKTALQNLIENACKFSDDKMATVSLICSNDEVEIRIFDKGPGIDKEELLNIFQPFYRANKTSKMKGHGIGLSLSQRIITLHQGVIEIDSTLGEGTQVTILFIDRK